MSSQLASSPPVDLEAIEEVPERQTEARTFALAVVSLLAREPAVTERRSYDTRRAAHGRRTLLLRGLRAIEAVDVRTTVRQAEDGRWRWYASRV